MDEKNPFIDPSQKLRPNYWRLVFFIVLLLMMVSNGLLFYLFQTKNDNVIKHLTKDLPITATIIPSPLSINTTNTSNSLSLELMSLTNRERLNLNQTYKILWKNQDLELWGDEIIICLVGFDSDGKEIAAKNQWNEQLCTYRSGDLSGSYLIAKTNLSSGGYNWTISNDLFNRYISQPTGFKIRLLVFDNLPSKGRTEWAGNVGWDESKDFLLIGKNP